MYLYKENGIKKENKNGGCLNYKKERQLFHHCDNEKPYTKKLPKMPLSNILLHIGIFRYSKSLSLKSI